jgi:polyhydroxyalkanoate synthesis regulator phasin
MPGLVDIVLQDGTPAAVPEENLALALSSGAKVDVASKPAAPDGGGLLGEAATAALGAGRTASMGFSDSALAEMANIVGGEQARKDFLYSANLAKQANPYSNMAGEFAGMFVGGPTAIGEGVETAVAEKVGEGLLGKVASFGARGAVEGALINYQDGITEATLGDHEANGQKLAAHIGEGALLGGVVGGALGAGAHGLTSAVESIRGARGPMSNAVMDEVAGAEGAGKVFKQRAETAQALTDELAAKAGMTRDQAAKVGDELLTMSRAKANATLDAAKDGGIISGALDDLHFQAMTKRAAGNAEALEAMQRHYQSLTNQILDHKAALDTSALKQKSLLDRVFRARETLDRLNFTERPDQFARLMGNEVNYAAARDMSARLGQETEAVVALLDSTATKGGGDVALKKIGKHLTDMRSKLAELPIEGGTAQQARDAYMSAYRLKQEVGRHAGFGVEEHLRTPAQREFTALYQKLAGGLESTEAYGRAGLANAEWNKAFSDGFRRAKDFEQRFAVRVDEVAGVPVPEASSEKIRDGLLRKMGSEVEREQPLKSTDEFVNWFKQRADVIERHAEILPSDAAKIADGRAALKEFEDTLAKTTKEAEIIARVERMQLEEQGKGIGGLIGLGADVVQRPMATIERLATLRNATKKVEDAIEGGLKRFFGGKSGPELVAEFKPRPSADVVKDIGEVKSLAANPAALDLRARQAVGDMQKVAPQTAEAAMATFKRAVYFLANEAPPAGVRLGVLALNAPEPRYTAQQLHEWETKKRAAFDPKTVVFDMKSGRLNREAIRTIEFVSPKLYMEIQHSAQEWVLREQQKGTIDKMPRAQQAALAALLKVPADGTWQPDFMLMMQAAKAQSTPQGGQGGPGGGAPPAASQTTRRAVKFNNGIYETEAYAIEKR